MKAIRRWIWWTENISHLEFFLLIRFKMSSLWIFQCTSKHKAKVFPSPEFKVCLLPPARKPSHTLTHTYNVTSGKREWRLFCLNWIGKKIFIELFVKRKYLLPGFVSEKWFFICRIFHPSTLLLILNPQSKIERQSDKDEGKEGFAIEAWDLSIVC